MTCNITARGVAAPTMNAVLPVVVVREDTADIHLGEQSDEVGEQHPESAVVAVSPPRTFGVRRHSRVGLRHNRV